MTPRDPTAADKAAARTIAERIGQRIIGELGPDGVIPIDAATDEIAQALAAARAAGEAAERERCAKIAETAEDWSTKEDGAYGGPRSCEYGCSHVIAEKIRVPLSPPAAAPEDDDAA